MQLQPSRYWPVPSFLPLVGGMGVVWLLLALATWLSDAGIARLLLTLFTGGVLLAAFVWYGLTSWGCRQGRATVEAFRRPMILLLFGWLLCLGSALASSYPLRKDSSGPTADSTEIPGKPAKTPSNENRKPSKLFPHGPRRYLSDMEEFDVQHGAWPITPNGQLGNGKNFIVVGGVKSPKGIGMHPPSAPKHASIKYRLHKEAAVFKAVVAVDDSANFCWTPAIFSVHGDGKELWYSKSIAHNHLRSQECRVDVTGVDVLELRVRCVGQNHGVYAVWVEPRLLQKPDTEDK